MVNLIENSEYEAKLLQEMESSFSENNFVKAIDLANKYLVFDSKDSAVNLLKAESLINLEKYELAIETLSRITKKDELLYYTFARVYLLSDNLDLAEKYIKKSLNLSKNNFDYIMLYSQILHLKYKDEDKYISFFLRGLLINPLFFADTIANNWKFNEYTTWELNLIEISEFLVIGKYKDAQKILKKLTKKPKLELINLILYAEILFQEDEFMKLNEFLIKHKNSLKKYSRFYYYLSSIEMYNYTQKIKFIDKAINMEIEKYGQNNIIEYDIQKIKLRASKYPEFADVIYKRLTNIQSNEI